MKGSLICILIGMALLAACGTQSTPPQGENAPETIQTVAVQAEAILSASSPVSPPPSPRIEVTASAIAQFSPLATPTIEATESPTTPVSPPPNPTMLVTTIPSPIETPPVAQTEAEKQVPGKLTEVMGEAVIIYQLSGGFAGINEEWTIHPDGRITVSDGRKWRVTPERVEQLLADIEALGFFEMSSRYMPLNTCCDRFTYGITVRRGDRTNTVTTIDAAPDAPDELWKVLETVSSLLAGLQ